MRSTCRLMSATVLAAALAASTAACGTLGSVVGTASTGTRTGPGTTTGTLTAEQIVQRAATDSANAHGVRYTGTVTASGKTVTIDLTVLRGKGCEGTLSLLGKGSIRLVYDGSTIWALPDRAFLKSLGLGSA